MKLKKICLIVFIFALILLTGCSELSSKNTLNTLIENIDNVYKTVQNVDEIQSSELLISEFMNESNLVKINVDYNEEPFDKYVNKLSSLNNTIIDAIDINNAIYQTKQELENKIKHIRYSCKLNLQNKTPFTDPDLDSLETLNNLIISNNTKISVGKNEITNAINLVKKNKDSLLDIQKLNSYYVKLIDGLNNRLACYKNLYAVLQQIKDIVCCEENVDIQIEDDIAKKSSLPLKNIDSFNNGYKRNSYKNDNSFNNNMNNAYRNPYMYGYYPHNNWNSGFGYYPPMMPSMMPGGYIYPNINTYWNYKNIDTYRLPNNTRDLDDDTYNNEEVLQETAGNLDNSKQDEHFVAIK